MTSPKPSKRERTRSALLVAVQELLLDLNVSSLSVPQIVERAGVAQGTFYNYFESLDDSVGAVGELVLLEHARVLGHVVEGCTDVAEVVARSSKQTLMLTTYEPDAGRLLFDSAVPVDLIASGIRNFSLHPDLVAGIDSGVLSVTNLDVTESIFVGTFLGAGLDLYKGRLGPDAIPEVVVFLLRLLGVSARKAERLASAPQEFVPWRPFPLTSIVE